MLTEWVLGKASCSQNRLRCILSYKNGYDCIRWQKNFDEWPHRRGGFFAGDGRPDGCIGCVLMLLLTTELSLLLRTLQWRFPVLFIGLNNPQNRPFPWGSRPLSTICYIGPTSAPRQLLDWFSRLHRTSFDQHTDTQTDTQITLRATAVAVGRIYVVHAMRPKMLL